MSPISRLPLPSIALVLTTDHALIPRRPSVISMAPSVHSPAKFYVPQTDMMQTIRSRDYEPVPPAYDWHVHEHHEKHVTFVEDNAPMELAESIYEERIVEGRSVIIRQVVKDKLSNILFTFRRILCVEIPQTCFGKISRH
ncbi:hypothetical protein D9619_012150 [Psilocybe cf. subviscida]|uniref:Uncharacterized protein n=1 Tax=Psilocybe cf. subviscida TaxID=2480587 RepID=A0A8H5EZZ0_9AGAR|nr:hypothetical protein D9619_012150 [Psilocybe cf. subviscida]